MLSQIDFYQPTEMTVEEAYELLADYEHEQRVNGEWEAITAVYGDIANKSPEWWEGFLSALARRNGVNVAVFQQHGPVNFDEF
jgi:hypothetical protein